MSGYKRPKKRLHREFLYLNHDTIINSLSALEAGKIDEIIQKANEAREGGLEGSLTAGPVKASGGKKRTATIQEELVKTRTWFSAFDAWYTSLKTEDALGTFDSWGLEVRDDLEVGDTIEFQADLTLAPLHKVFRTFTAFATEAQRAGSVFHQTGKELAETKKSASMMTDWMGGRDKPMHLPVYMEPGGVAEPRIVGRLDEQYIVTSGDTIEGRYTVIAQVEQLLAEGQTLSAIRVIRDVPPTPMETKTINDAMTGMIEPAKELGVEISAADISIPAPAVIVRPIAVFR
ncbi:MAG: DUF6414 family protein [Jatrophihabitans sp.]